MSPHFVCCSSSICKVQRDLQRMPTFDQIIISNDIIDTLEDIRKILMTKRQFHERNNG